MVEDRSETAHHTTLLEFIGNRKKCVIVEPQLFDRCFERLIDNIDILLQLFDDRDMEWCEFDRSVGSFFDLLFFGPLSCRVHLDGDFEHFERGKDDGIFCTGLLLEYLDRLFESQLRVGSDCHREPDIVVVIA